MFIPFILLRKKLEQTHFASCAHHQHAASQSRSQSTYTISTIGADTNQGRTQNVPIISRHVAPKILSPTAIRWGKKHCARRQYITVLERAGYRAVALASGHEPSSFYRRASELCASPGWGDYAICDAQAGVLDPDRL